jgi:hypothetical protein
VLSAAYTNTSIDGKTVNITSGATPACPAQW